MKKSSIVVVAVLMLAAAIPAFSAETTPQEEYICKLEARKCMTQLEAAQEKIQKINQGIESGATYSEADLKKLQKKLKELNDLLDKMKPVRKK
jgi:Skp family chaperone for outer membrane proteins